jgi:hypothetical protein
LVVVATLGVAIASATVIYSVVDVVWHFIPAVNQDRLVYVASTDTRVVQAEGGAAASSCEPLPRSPTLPIGARDPRRSSSSRDSGWARRT